MATTHFSGPLVVKNNTVAITENTAVKTNQHSNTKLVLNSASGAELTLPAAAGSGASFEFLVGTSVTSNSYKISALGADEFAGSILNVDTDTGDALAAWAAAAADNFNTITLNGTTTGGLVGDHVALVDVAPGVWAVRGLTQGTGTVATPFSSV